MAVTLYAMLPLAVTVLSPGLGLYVLSRNPYLRAGKAFFLTMVLVGTFGLCHYALLVSPDPETALARGSLAMFVGILVFGSLWYLTALLPYARGRSWPAEHPRPFWGAVIVLAFLAGAAVDQVVMTEVGYGLPLTPAVFAGELIGLLLALGATVTAATVGWRSQNRRFRRQCALLAIIPLLPYVVPFIQFAGGKIPLVAPAFLGMGLAYAYLVLEHRIFTIAFASHRPDRKTIAPGGAILVKGRDPQSAYRLFAEEVRAGASGLVVGRAHPDMAREALGLPDVPFLWLSSQPGPDHIDPTSLGILQHSITGFISKGSQAVVLLDGVEYLITYNSLDKVLRMLYAVRDTVTIAGSKLIIPLDPLTLSDRDLALVEKEFQVQAAEA